MTDDDLFEPSLGEVAGGDAASYNPYWAVAPGLLGGPVAVTLGLILVGRRLRVDVSRLVLIAVIGAVVWVGTAALIVVGMVPTGGGFRLAAIAAFAVQIPLVLPKFKAWSLRGRETESFLGPGLGVLAAGFVIDAICLAVVRVLG